MIFERYLIWLNFARVRLQLKFAFIIRPKTSTVRGSFLSIADIFGQRTMGVGSGEQGGHGTHRIFIHGTNIINKGLIVLFFGFFFAIFRSFFPLPPTWKRLNSAIFRSL